jgi:DUF2997 family protein
MKHIIITIAPDGQSTVVAEGFAGSECQDATASVRAALGQATAEQLTAEYYQTAATSSQTHMARQ